MKGLEMDSDLDRLPVACEPPSHLRNRMLTVPPVPTTLIYSLMRRASALDLDFLSIANVT